MGAIPSRSGKVAGRHATSGLPAAEAWHYGAIVPGIKLSMTARSSLSTSLQLLKRFIAQAIDRQWLQDAPLFVRYGRRRTLYMLRSPP